MNAQDALDKGQKKLHRIMKGLEVLAGEAGVFADEICRQGDNATSAKIRAMEADLKKAAGFATDAYSKGRALDVGGVTARSGDK